LNPRALLEYENYVAAQERAMPGRFDAGELAWAPDSAAKEAAAQLASGKVVSRSIGDAALNQRIASQNGTIVHWVGAVRIRGANIADLRSVLEDYAAYDRVYQPTIFSCRARKTGDSPDAAYDVTLGLQNVFRVAALFPQHYAFRVKGRAGYSRANGPDASVLRVHLGATEIRESDSGVPGRTDFLEQRHDHGIMWALNAYWRARQRDAGLYLEFETITLARSAQAFDCKIAFIPVPRSIVSAAMDSIPAESVSVILKGTRTECERRASRQRPDAAGQ
jgi:hypothetical protein